MLEWVEKTDVGRVRSVNEDRSIVIGDGESCVLAIVADGMGGHQAGEVASQLAIDVVSRQLKQQTDDLSLDDCEDRMIEAVKQANYEIFSLAATHEQYVGMGTTLVAALASSDEVVIAYVGDSRAYIAHGENFRLLTEDHSLVNELVKNGQLDPDEAKDHPRRNVLMRAVGTEQEVKIDIERHSWSKGDLLLLCSDGLNGLVEEEQLQTIVSSDADLQWKADELIHRALQAGGDDNITLIMLVNSQADDNEEKR